LSDSFLPYDIILLLAKMLFNVAKHGSGYVIQITEITEKHSPSPGGRGAGGRGKLQAEENIAISPPP
jgi:hypothetical protein